MYQEYNDYELLEYIAEKDEDAQTIMYKKYEPLINGLAKKIIKLCKGTGLEIADLEQEGMLGLNHAINTFKEGKDAIFYTYAKTCIERRMVSQIVASSRLKRKILNESISIDEKEEYCSLVNFVKDDTKNPENILLSSEYIENIMKEVEDALTDFELAVFELKVNDFNYKEISEILDKDPKAVDNAIQRIRLKFKKILKKGE